MFLLSMPIVSATNATYLLQTFDPFESYLAEVAIDDEHLSKYYDVNFPSAVPGLLPLGLALVRGDSAPASTSAASSSTTSSASSSMAIGTSFHGTSSVGGFGGGDEDGDEKEPSRNSLGYGRGYCENDQLNRDPAVDVQGRRAIWPPSVMRIMSDASTTTRISALEDVADNQAALGARVTDLEQAVAALQQMLPTRARRGAAVAAQIEAATQTTEDPIALAAPIISSADVALAEGWGPDDLLYDPFTFFEQWANDEWEASSPGGGGAPQAGPSATPYSPSHSSSTTTAGTSSAEPPPVFFSLSSSDSSSVADGGVGPEENPPGSPGSTSAPRPRTTPPSREASKVARK